MQDPILPPGGRICQMIYPNYKPKKFYNFVHRSSAVRTLMGGGQSGNADQGPIL